MNLIAIIRTALIYDNDNGSKIRIREVKQSSAVQGGKPLNEMKNDKSKKSTLKCRDGNESVHDKNYCICTIL